MFTKHKQGDGGSKCEFSSNVSSSEMMWVQLPNPEMKIENENLGQWQWKVKSQEDGGCWFHPDGSLTRIEQRAFVKI